MTSESRRSSNARTSFVTSAPKSGSRRADQKNLSQAARNVAPRTTWATLNASIWTVDRLPVKNKSPEIRLCQLSYWTRNYRFEQMSPNYNRPKLSIANFYLCFIWDRILHFLASEKVVNECNSRYVVHFSIPPSLPGNSLSLSWRKKRVSRSRWRLTRNAPLPRNDEIAGLF